MAGRHTKLTKALQDQIVGMIGLGAYPDVAAAACGVSRRTFFEWIARGNDTHTTRKPTKALTDFAESVERAVALAEMQALSRLAEFERGTRRGTRKPVVRSRMTAHQAMATQWRMARRWPERWGGRPTVAVTTGGTLTAADVDAAAEERRPIIQILVYPDPDGVAGEHPVVGTPEASAELEDIRAEAKADEQRRLGADLGACAERKR